MPVPAITQQFYSILLRLNSFPVTIKSSYIAASSLPHYVRPIPDARCISVRSHASSQAFLLQEADQRSAQASHRTQPHGAYGNYGEYLYIEGLSGMERRRQQALIAAKEREDDELKNATFRPRISPRSRVIIDDRARASVWERLGYHTNHAATERKRQMYKDEAEQATLAECTFHPKVRLQNVKG
jgi:hypothetical protein